MTITILVVIAIIAGLVVALYFQIKAAHKQSDDQQQLLADYQQRVDEQQKLLDDYRALEKNFDSVGEGYEQALLAFDKMEEERNQMKGANEALESRCNALQEENTHLKQTAQKKSEALAKTIASLKQLSQETGIAKLAALAGGISDLDDVEDQEPISRTDNIMVAQIANSAIKASGIESVTYLKFDLQVADDASYTMLSTNEAKASRALTHLLDNALKFTTEGTVTLKVTVDMDKMQAIYTVEDTGAGIAPEDAERIFEPYVRLNQFFDGQGIGLTVARQIARRLQGDLTYEPAEGGGSRFTLILPI